MAMAGLAGCSGQNPNDPSVGTDDPNGKRATTLSMRAPISWTPKTANINPFATQGDIEYWMEYMWWESLTYPNAVGEPAMWLAKDISLEGGGCKAVITLKEDYTWWDGSPVTAKDVWTTAVINDYITHGGPDKAGDSWKVNGEYEIVHNLSGPANPSIQKTSADYLNLVAKNDYFQSWIDKLEDADGKKAVEKVVTNLKKDKITLADLTEKGLGCGLWKPTSYDPTQAVHEKHSDHPRADWTSLEKFTWELVEDDQKAIQEMGASTFDMGDKLLKQAKENDETEVFSEFITPGMPKLAMNFKNKHLARRPVRRAIAYLIDHEELVQVIKTKQGQPYQPHNNVTGLSSILYDEWLPEEYRGKLIDYGVDAQPEKAKKTLENAGYTKDGDVWVGPDGDPIKGLKYLTPPWSIYETIGKYVSPKLKQFGIKNKLTIPSSSGFWKSWDETFDFDMCNWFSNAPHPASAFTIDGAQGLGKYLELYKPNKNNGSSCAVDRSVPELTQKRSNKLNHPLRPQFPKTVGSMEIEGEGQTLYPIKWNNIMTQTQKQSEVKDLAQKLVWFHNWQVPHIEFYEETRTFWGKTGVFDFPKPDKQDDHPNAKETMSEHRLAAIEFLMKGHIDAKTG